MYGYLKYCILLLILQQPFVLPAQPPKITASKPFVLGRTDILRSDVLAEDRTINIYLPAGYNENDSARYPVVYLLDGGADEDFIHIVGLFQFNNFPWIDRVPKSIVVGIANVDRRRDFTYPTSIKADKEQYKTSGQSGRFMRFIEQELQPYISKQFRTNASRMLIGQSLGALFATEVLLTKPRLFDKYIIVSPSLWWDDGSLLRQNSPMLDESFTQPTAVYIAVGKEGLAPGTNSHVMEVDANLLAEKLAATRSRNVKIHFDYLPAENHATVTHQAVFNALRWIYP